MWKCNFFIYVSKNTANTTCHKYADEILACSDEIPVIVNGQLNEIGTRPFFQDHEVVYRCDDGFDTSDHDQLRNECMQNESSPNGVEWSRDEANLSKVCLPGKFVNIITGLLFYAFNKRFFIALL